MNRILSSLAAVLMLAAAGLAGAPPAHAGDQVLQFASASELSGRVFRLGAGKSMIVNLGEDVRDILVSNPGIADAVVRTNRQVYIIGMGTGETNVFLFGEGGRQIAQFELSVGRDVTALRQMIAEVIPGSDVKVKSIGDSVVLSGTVSTPEAALTAVQIANSVVGEEKVVNSIGIANTDQIHLKVVVAEVEREVVKDLGVNTQSLLQNTALSGAITASQSLSPAGDWVANLTGRAGYTGSLGSMIQLLNQKRVIRTLAEPTLTAISGESANFLVGGEFPIPMVDSEGRLMVEYKKFGVQLSFRPIVLSPGRISLQIMTEVSELSDVGAVEISGLAIPSLSIRRAESTVELPSGGSIVMAGLIRDNVRQTLAGFPGLMDVPVLGNLFRSRQYQRNQTELAIFVSPYLVNPLKPNEVTLPDEGLVFAGDAQTLFLNQINRVYSKGAGGTATAPYFGRYGFSYE